MDRHELDVAALSVYETVKLTLERCPNASLETCIETSVWPSMAAAGLGEDRKCFAILKQTAVRAYDDATQKDDWVRPSYDFSKLKIVPVERRRNNTGQ